MGAGACGPLLPSALLCRRLRPAVRNAGSDPARPACRQHSHPPAPRLPTPLVPLQVDEDIICARGRGGGIAVWARATPQWELKAGIV